MLIYIYFPLFFRGNNHFVYKIEEEDLARDKKHFGPSTHEIFAKQVYETIKNGGNILFVSTKKQASESIANLAKDTSQYFVNYRWLGGMLTNWGTISNSIKKLEKIKLNLSSENRGFTKKELLKMSLLRDKLERSLGGISKMKKVPDLIFVIDTNYESLAI